MKSRVSTTLLLALLLNPLAVADDTLKELKQKLFDRYDQKNFSVVHDKVLVALLAEGSGFSGRGKNGLEYSINYDFFDPAFSKDKWPKKYKTRNLLDEYTTEEVEAGARFTDTLAQGEMAQIRLLYVNFGNNGEVQIDMYLVPLTGRRNASAQNVYGNAAGVSYKLDWGCHFRLIIPPKAPGIAGELYFDYIADRIGRFFIPTADYLRIQKANTKPIDPATVPGKYVDERDGSQFVQLNPDKKYLFHTNGKDYNGKYDVTGYELTFIPEQGQSSTARLAGDVIISGASSTWVKQQALNVATAPAANSEALANDDVLKLVRAKLPDGVVISKIKASVCKFDTTTETLITLKEAGVGDSIIQAMVECHGSK